VKKIAIGVAAAVLVVPVVLFGAVSFAVQVSCLDACMTPGRAHTVTSDIPIEMGGLYERAADRFGIPWPLLAAVGRVECDHGRDPRCSRPNEAGAEGPMQFLPATFARWSWASGSPDPSPYDATDAVCAAAAKLAADGAATDPSAALFSYNHSAAYVAEVESWALRYGWEPPEASVLATAVLDHPRLRLRPLAEADIRAGLVDPRVLRLLLVAATTHRLSSVGPLVSGHGYFVSGTDRPSNHAFGRAVDIPVVDGEPVSKDNDAALDVVSLVGHDVDEVGSPWPHPLDGPRTFDEGHSDHLHFGWDA
jgi:hypothetical protein